MCPYIALIEKVVRCSCSAGITTTLLTNHNLPVSCMAQRATDMIASQLAAVPHTILFDSAVQLAPYNQNASNSQRSTCSHD